MTADQVAALMAARGYRVRAEAGGYRTACPAHGGDDPNMTIRPHPEGGAILTCHSHHCTRPDMARGLGLTMADLAAPKANGHAPEPRVYPYRDETGKVLFEVVREPDKRFWQRLPGAAKGGIGDVRRVLFGLPELLATAPGELIGIAEGEKCAIAVASLGIACTTNPHGAGKWRPEYTVWLKEHLADRRFLVLPDNDATGKEHAVHVGESLRAAGLEVYLAELGELPEKGDVVQWIAKGGTAEQLRAMAALPPKSERQREREEERRIISARDLLAKRFDPLHWAVPDMIPEGLTILAGGPKTGKSWMAMHMAIAIASGGHVFGQIPVQKGGALYLALEDSQRRLQDRLVKCLQGAEAPEELYLVTHWDVLGEGFAEQLSAWLGEHPDCRMVIVDVFQRVRPKKKKDGPEYQEDSDVMTALQEIPKEHRIAMLILHHTRKTPSLDSVDMVHGSVGVTGGVDTVLVLVRQRDQKEATLHIVSRECDTASKQMEWDGQICCWNMLGDAADHRMTAERREVLDFLRTARTEARPSEIAAVIGKNPNAVQYLLSQLLEEGLVTKSHFGKYLMTDLQRAMKA